MKKWFVALGFAAAALTTSPAVAELKGQIIFRDTFYGALTGGIIGGAAMVFTDHPEDHFMYIAYGAATGAIVGAAFGAYESTAVAEYRDGNLYLSMPTVRVRPDSGGVEAAADLFSMQF